MDVAETIRFLNQGLDFVLESREITFEAIVFALQSLDTSEVLAEVVGGEEEVLLVDPGDGLIGVTIKPLKIVKNFCSVYNYHNATGENLSVRTAFWKIIDTLQNFVKTYYYRLLVLYHTLSFATQK